MLARSGPLPTSGGWVYEVKWDGFRAIVRTGRDFRVRSRRGWDMTALVPELRALPVDAVLDGELVAFEAGVPHFPLVCDRLLHGDDSVPLWFVPFDVLELGGESLQVRPWRERRQLLEELDVNGPSWFTADVFDDGAALFAAVQGRGMGGV